MWKCTAEGTLEIILFELRGERHVLWLLIVRRFGLDWKTVPDPLDDPLVVEPVDSLKRRELRRLQGSPGPVDSILLDPVPSVDGSAKALPNEGPQLLLQGPLV